MHSQLSEEENKTETEIQQIPHKKKTLSVNNTQENQCAYLLHFNPSKMLRYSTETNAERVLDDFMGVFRKSQGGRS